MWDEFRWAPKGGQGVPGAAALSPWCGTVMGKEPVPVPVTPWCRAERPQGLINGEGSDEPALGLSPCVLAAGGEVSSSPKCHRGPGSPIVQPPVPGTPCPTSALVFGEHISGMGPAGLRCPTTSNHDLGQRWAPRSAPPWFLHPFYQGSNGAMGALSSVWSQLAGGALTRGPGHGAGAHRCQGRVGTPAPTA